MLQSVTMLKQELYDVTRSIMKWELADCLPPPWNQYDLSERSKASDLMEI